MAKLTRPAVAKFILGYFSKHFHMPESYFKEDTNLRDDLLYTSESLVELGKWINRSNWHKAYVMPREIAACETIGDIIDLIWNKAK
jgi:hypothetical protein